MNKKMSRRLTPDTVAHITMGGGERRIFALQSNIFSKAIAHER